MSLHKSIVANYLGQGWVAIMNLAFIPYYIEILGPEAFGLIGVFAMLQAVISLLDLGMTPALGREMSRFISNVVGPQEIRDLLRTVETIAVGIAILLLTVSLFFSSAICEIWLHAESLSPKDLSYAFLAMVTVLVIRFFENIYKGCLMGLHKQVLFNAVNSTFVTLRQAGALVIIALVSPTIHGFMYWQAITSALGATVLALFVYRSIPRAQQPGRFSIGAIRQIKNFAIGMIGITSLTILLTQVDKFMLSAMLSLEDFGFYSLASMIASVLSLLVTPIAQAVYPKFVSTHAARNENLLIDTYHMSAQLVTVLVAPVAIVLAVNSKGAIYAWTGDAATADATSSILSLLVIGTFLNSLMWIPYQCMLAHGVTKITLISNSVAVLLLLPSLPFIIPYYGAPGAAFAWLILNTGYLIFTVHYFHQSILKQEKWAWYGFDVAIPTIAALAAVILMQALPFHLKTTFQWQLFLLCDVIIATVIALAVARRINVLFISSILNMHQHFYR